MAARPTPLPEDHDALVAAAVAGDERAVRGVLDVVVPAVTRYCRARTSRLQDGARSTEDVAQDAVLAVVAALPRYRPGVRPFLAFVLTVANHKMLDAYRAAARRRTAALPEELELVDLAPLPDQRAECAEESAALGHLLDGLLPRQREILMMRLVFGMSAEEVASVLGTSAGAVRVAQHRALTTLRRKLEARRGWVTPVGAVSISEERST
jgi:RNA polymerase sigma-70 factor (ECF subfamily)